MIHRIVRAVKHIHERATGRIPKGSKRSPHWHAFVKKIVEEVGECEACPATKKLEGHHVQPFHEKPELELARENVIVLCRRCHQEHGHFDHWAWSNPNVRADAAEQKRKFIKAQAEHDLAA